MEPGVNAVRIRFDFHTGFELPTVWATRSQTPYLQLVPLNSCRPAVVRAGVACSASGAMDPFAAEALAPLKESAARTGLSQRTDLTDPSSRCISLTRQLQATALLAVQGAKRLLDEEVKALAQLLNEMRASGVIQNYALFGAVAQMRYTEPVATLDADVLVSVAEPDRLDTRRDIYAFCARRGYLPEGEAIRVGAWPTQFVPVFTALTREALEQAETADFEGVPFRVVQAAHLAVIALSVGRAKDFTRILSLLESGAVTRQELRQLADRHGMSESWQKFERRFLDE